MSQKLIATIIVIGLILGLNFNLFIVKPQIARALDGGGSWATAMKEIVLDAIGWTVADMVIKPLEQKITNWGLGRTSDSNIPFAVTDWGQYFKDALDRGAGKFIADYERTFDLSDKFQSSIKSSLDSLGFDTYPKDLSDYTQLAKPTLKNDLEKAGINYQEFVDSGYSLTKGGWAGWFSMMKPENNLFGQALMAEQEKFKRMTEEKEAANKEADVSGGYKNETTTTETDVEACYENCRVQWDKCMAACGGGTGSPCEQMCSAESAGCMKKKCESKPGIAIQTKIKNIGSDIHKQIDNAMSADMQRIISADEISELLGIFFSSLVNKATSGLGMYFGQTTVSLRNLQRAQNKEEFSYKNELGPLEIKSVRGKVLTTILKGVQSLSRSITDCTSEDTLIKEADYSKNINDIAEASLQALYVGLEGANLKPDFEVLDPPYAPYTINGYGWGEIPSEKIPTRCQEIIKQENLRKNATCKDFQSGLEPNYNPRCTDCLYDGGALNCPPGPTPPIKTVLTDADEPIIKAKQDFYNKCRGWYLTTQERCVDCLKKADEKCNQDNETTKENCIQNYCGNFKDLISHVVSPIKDGLDFYNKCLVEEQKQLCFTCLKEYFVPAQYCSEIGDYMTRAMIKYPTVVVGTSDDDGHFIGRYDATFTKIAGGDKANECNNDENLNKDIDLALICRIMPNFLYQNQQVCKTRCSSRDMTEDQLNDITDFRPNSKDCGKQTLPIGGKLNVWNIVNDGTLLAVGKCCAVSWQFDKDKYTTCVGSGASTTETGTCTYAVPPDQEPWCYCEEGYRPLGFTRTGNPSRGNGTSMGGDCGDFTFQYPAEGLPKGNEIYGVTNNSPVKGDAVYIGDYPCKEGEIADVDIHSSGSEEFDSGGGGASVLDPIAPWGNNWAALSNGSKIQHIFTEAELSGGVIHTGVYITAKGQDNHNANRDPNNSTGWDICALCDENYAKYPNYGTAYDQCHKNK